MSDRAAPIAEIPAAHKLLKKGALRDALGLPKHNKMVSAACWWGFKMPGGVSTVAKFQAWLDENPEFSVQEYDKFHRTGKGRHPADQTTEVTREDILPAAAGLLREAIAGAQDEARPALATVAEKAIATLLFTQRWKADSQEAALLRELLEDHHLRGNIADYITREKIGQNQIPFHVAFR